MSSIARTISIFGIVAATLACSQFVLRAQVNDQQPSLQPAKPGTRFVFEVIESFDAKYEGDTPGHIGRGGNLGNVRPNIALGDAVYRGDERIGTITTVTWSRVQGSLTLEFDPATGARVSVGDNVWIDLNPQSAGSKAQ